MAENILVTGGTGLLGGPLTQHLKTLSYRVSTQGRGAKPSDFVFDLCDKAATFRYLDQLRPDVIVNLAALTNVDLCEKDRQLAYRQNVHTVENLASWISERTSTTSLIHVSTDQVYEGPGEKDESRVTLLNTYAWSKYCAELVAARVGGISLRTNFFGKSLNADRTSFSDWLLGAVARGEAIQLFSDIYFSPLSIGTLTRAIARVIERPVPGIYNLGSRAGLSKAEFALELLKVFNLSTEKTTIVTSGSATLFAPRPRDMRMSSSLFEERFGLRLPSLLEEIRTVKGEYEVPKSVSNRQTDHRPGAADLLHR